MPADAGRKLVLLRHAKSAWPDVPDDERPLARRGQRDAPAMGRWLRDAALVPDHVLCSPARRARETWHLAQAGLGTSPPVRFDDRAYQASAAQLLDLIRGASPAARTLLVVGHDPALPDLALTLAAAALSAHAEPASSVMAIRMRTLFPTAAVAVLGITGNWDQLTPRSARLTHFMRPRDLSAPARPESDTK